MGGRVRRRKLHPQNSHTQALLLAWTAHGCRWTPQVSGQGRGGLGLFSVSGESLEWQCRLGEAAWGS